MNTNESQMYCLGILHAIESMKADDSTRLGLSLTIAKMFLDCGPTFQVIMETRIAEAIRILTENPQ